MSLALVGPHLKTVHKSFFHNECLLWESAWTINRHQGSDGRSLLNPTQYTRGYLTASMFLLLPAVLGICLFRALVLLKA